MEGDPFLTSISLAKYYFYPRPPGGGRPMRKASDIISFLSTPSGWRATSDHVLSHRIYLTFLSTPSGWRATRCRHRQPALCPDFYPRPPGGGRHANPVPQSWPCNFYPRPPGGGRRMTATLRLVSPRFLSTPSGWRATFPALPPWVLPLYFYPRPPGGGRQQKRTKFSSVFAQKGEEFASLRRGKREFAGGVLKRTNFGF